MNKPKYAKIILYLCLLAIAVRHVSAQSQPASSKGPALGVGRTDPFAVPPKARVATERITSAATVQTQQVDLVVQTVTLKVLSAKSVKTAIARLSSSSGSIAVDTKTNSLIICDTEENLEKIIAQIHRAEGTTTLIQSAVADQNELPLFAETATLKFLDATSLQTTITKMSSSRGSISVDASTNSLIICDTKEKLKKILAEIKKIDKTPRHITVEVVILDVQLNNDNEIGVNWDLLSDKNYDVLFRQGLTSSRLGSTIEDAATIGNATAFVTTGFGGDLSVISGNIRNVIHMIQQKREVEILASPSIMMLSGESGYIEAVEELPYEEVIDSAGGGVGALTSTEFKDVGVKLTVSAIITDDDDIFLTINTEQNVATGTSNTDIPIIDTRKANTSLMLRDGQLVIMGGLRRQEKTKEVDQIPFFGDLPLIGPLFRNTSDVVKHSELVVFLVPHIYDGKPVPDEYLGKFREITERPLLSLPPKKDLLSPMSFMEKVFNKEPQGVIGLSNEALTASEQPLARRIRPLPAMKYEAPAALHE